MQHLGINIKKLITVIAISLLLSGCTWLNASLYYEGESGDKDTLPVLLWELIEMAEYCNEAYEDVDENYGVKKNEFSYSVKQDRGVTIISFRGTANAKNFLSDIDLRPWKDDELSEYYYGIGAEHKDVYLHRGFRDAAFFTLEDIKKNYKLEKTVYLTGHSLGGAIAQIIGLWLNYDGYNIQIYTFGSPKVSTTFFGNRPLHYRVALRNDPVPFTPPYPFIHSGISIDPETLNWMEGGETDRDSFTEIDGRDHSIKEYYDILMERAFPQLCEECK